MKLTKRGEYALRLLIRLGLEHFHGESAVAVSVLAVRECLPSKFAENILATLRTAGYVETVRGKDGGARLAKPMHSINLGDVLRFIEGDLSPVTCVNDLNYERCSCPHEESCGLRMLMIDVHRAVSAILDRYSLGDVVTLMARRSSPPESITGNHTDTSKRSRSDPADGFLAMFPASQT